MRIVFRIATGILTALQVFLLAFSGTCFGESGNGFSVRRVGNIISFRQNAFLVTAPESGKLTIRICDDVSVYRTITQNIPAGETQIEWDGCGYNREKLFPKSYTVSCTLECDSGKSFSVSFLSPVEYTGQALQYALPSSDKAYLSASDEWFIEYRTVMKGQVIIEMESEEQPENTFFFQMTTVGGKIYRKDFSEITGKRTPSPGNYRVAVYEASVPSERFCFDLQVLEKMPEKPAVFLTGSIMPERGMSDAEIWEYMMRPSVVVDIDFFKHQKVYAEKNEGSPVLGTLHGQTQALQVFRLEDGWALIGAWNHEEGEYIEGWVPSDRLKVETPQRTYGLLIDKQEQTISIYENGTRLDTLLISSGRPEKRELYQETSAGSFLTGYHRVDFSMNGKKYDYVIQYDGGNLLHQIPYQWGKEKKDFSDGRSYLGAKASHACIRIQSEPGEGGLNAYWIWTHIPYHTRVIILDDPDERQDMKQMLTRSESEQADTGMIGVISDIADLQNVPETVAVTFAGNLTAGGKRGFNARKDSFVSMLLEGKADELFSELNRLMETDDLTCVTLSCVPEAERTSASKKESNNVPADALNALLRSASVELTNLCSDAVCNSGSAESAGKLIREETHVVSRDQVFLTELKGHLFGFAGCLEKDYIKDPGRIDRLAEELKQAGCERVIFLCSWGKDGDSLHSVVQESMAHRCVRAGADLVIGLNSGTVQGVAFYESIPILYGIGDLLDGSTDDVSGRQGILVRAEFNMSGTESVSLVIIPLCLSGADNSGNDYTPVPAASCSEAEKTIDAVWKDSPDSAIRKIRFFCSGQ